LLRLRTIDAQARPWRYSQLSGLLSIELFDVPTPMSSR
jgi:hypothetical protein